MGIDFSNDGEFLYIADCTTLTVYSTRTGLAYRTLYMKNHEIELISHTHNSQALLVATKKGHEVLYWSIHENKILKQFKGHRDTISNLSICPKNDCFLTTSHDNSLRIWSINKQDQSNNTTDSDSDFRLGLESHNISMYPVADYDPTGLVFGVAWMEQRK